jgi:hypothetical protein
MRIVMGVFVLLFWVADAPAQEAPQDVCDPASVVPPCIAAPSLGDMVISVRAAVGAAISVKLTRAGSAESGALSASLAAAPATAAVPLVPGSSARA